LIFEYVKCGTKQKQEFNLFTTIDKIQINHQECIDIENRRSTILLSQENQLLIQQKTNLEEKLKSKIAQLQLREQELIYWKEKFKLTNLIVYKVDKITQIDNTEYSVYINPNNLKNEVTSFIHSLKYFKHLSDLQHFLKTITDYGMN